MTLDRLIGHVALLALVAIVTAGCGGFAASKSVSPASFFLPGLLQNSPSGTSPLDPMTNSSPATTLAQVK